MKKIILIIITILLINPMVFSQNYVDDALKFSTNNYGGTARFVSMGGAFGALGGDFSSISINPAGLGVYRSSEFVFSPGMSYNLNTSTYINNTIDESGYNMSFNNLGFVASYDLEDSDTRWVNFNIGVGFNRTNNLNDDVMFEGVNKSSLMEVFVHFANLDATPTTAENLNGMYEYLLWDAYILDSAGGVFYNEIDDDVWTDSDFRINQRKIIKTEGSVSEFNFSFGGNYAHKLYIGASIGIKRLRYSQYSSHYEYETADNPIDYMYAFNFKENYTTRGIGYTLKLGAIYKPVEFLRIGAAFHLPTFYDFTQESYNEVYGYFDNDPLGNAKSQDQFYDYQLQTPLRAMGSVGFQIGKIALIDVDYEFADYSKMSLDDNIKSEGVITDNNTINDIYQITHNIRAGAEFRFGPLYVRGGGAYSTSPYVNMDDYETITIAGGLGYREKNFFVDFAYAQTSYDYYMSAYDWEFNNAVAHIENKMNNFILTLGVKF